MIPPGTILAGKYRVEHVLGQGGMGVVVRATHLQLQQPVAVKLLLPEVLTRAEVVQRFLREAQAVVRLKSEHVARVLDVGSLETGAPYMVLEYLDGTDLAGFPRQELTVGQIANLMLQACEALAEAHAMGIVHRDIKPGNFFITRRADGSHLMKVLDFGISKIQHASLEGNLTATATVMGTPAYMSPEQIRSTRDVDHRSDIWSLGIVLYELLAGAPPFTAETFGSMALKIALEPPLPLAAHLPAGLAEVVQRCLEKDPARRFQSVAELAHALAPFAHSTAEALVSVERAHRVLGTDPGRSLSTLRSSSGAIAQPPPPARRWPLAFGAVAALGVSVAVAFVIARGGDGRSGPGSDGDGGKTHSGDVGSVPVDRSPPPPPATASPPLPSPSPDPRAAPAIPPDAAVVAAPAPPVDAAIPPGPADAPPQGALPARTPKQRPPSSAASVPAKPPPPPAAPGDILDLRR